MSRTSPYNRGPGAECAAFQRGLGGGNFNGSPYVPDETLTELGRGARRSIVPSPNSSATENGLNGVTVLSAEDVWAVGLYVPAMPSVSPKAGIPPTHTLILHYHRLLTRPQGICTRGL
jgi:hypothetical protein